MLQLLVRERCLHPRGRLNLPFGGGWIALILKTQAEGNFEFAAQYSKDNGTIKSDLQSDLDRINKSGIPRDIRFNQGLDVLGLK